MAEYLYKINDKVRMKYFEGKDNDIRYIVVNRYKLDDSEVEDYRMTVNVYIIESIGVTPIQEKYVDEIYLMYDKNYLRQQKIKFLENENK